MAARGQQHIGKDLEAQLVIAIDFGTTGTGYAFQTRADFKSDRLKIYENLDWNQASLQYKTSTCLLVNPDKTRVWFGYEAEEQYTQLSTEDHPENWYFFRNFKMQIYGKEISSDMTLVSENGNKLTALFVFSESIKWVKDHALQYIEFMSSRYLEQTTKWVLTVPAIWKEDEKNLMREAAQKAGIKSQNLCIALEPEVAAVYYSAAEANPPNDPQRDFENTIWTGPGTTNIIVDMGGGTVDITTIEVQKDGTMKQIHMAEGGPMGGQKVDEKFFSYMSEIFGPRLWAKFAQKHPSGFYDFRMSFEKAKRAIPPKLLHSDDKDQFQIILSSFIIQEFERENGKSINEIFSSNKLTKDKVSLQFGKLVFKGEILRTIMQESLDEIIWYVTKVAHAVKQNGRRVHAVILVGGFASSTFLTKEIKSSLEGTLGVIVKRPPHCQLAVLRGAVLYGHNENILISRVVRMTYGIGAAMPCMSTTQYPKEKMFRMDGSMYANGVFVPHVVRGQEVRIDEWIPGDEYYPLEEDQNEIEIHIFSSESKDPQMIDDNDCNCIGKFDVKLEEDGQSGSRLNTASTEISFMFGRTELIIKAKDTTTGNEVYKSLCLKD